MGFFSDIRVDRNLTKCMTVRDLSGPEAAQTLMRLRKIAPTSVSKLMQRLARATGDEAERIEEIMEFLLDDETLPYYRDGLKANAHPRVLKAMVRVFCVAKTYQPNALLPFLSDAELSQSALLRIVQKRVEDMDHVALLSKAYGLPPAERSALFKILMGIKDDALIPELVNRANAQDPGIRLGVVRLLSRYDTAVTRSTLMERLQDEHKQVRAAALDALAEMNTPVDIGVLCKLLRDPDMKIQNRAIEVVIQRNDPATVSHLVELLKDKSEHVRRAGVEVLNGLEFPSAVEDLLMALKDEDWWVRARAADALARIGGRRVVEAVVRLLRSDDEYIRRSAVEILNSTRDEVALEHLLEALGDSDWWVRERAIDALAKIGNKAAVPALVKLMYDDVQAAPVVLRALVTLGTEHNVRDVLSMLGSDDNAVVIESLQTLAELVDAAQAERVVKAIKRRAHGGDDDLRSAALGALKRINARLVGSRSGSKPKRRAEASASPPQRRRASDQIDRQRREKKLDVTRLKPGDMIGDRYKFIRRVGRGAFSTVLLVKDLEISEELILKVLHDKMTSDSAMIKRFIRELKYSRKINHEHVIRIYDFIRIAKMRAISMEYFPSMTLSSELEQKKPLPFDRAIHIAASVASGIAAANDMGVVHRDLKPGNILINKKNQVKIVDFGISAAMSTSDTKLTKTGILIGTPRYMAPEQVLGKKLDGRTDIYSLGVIFYEMLVGKTAFAGDDNMAVLYQHVHGNIDPVHKVNPDVPLPLSNIVSRMMAVHPRKRYQSMHEVEETLRSYKL